MRVPLDEISRFSDSLATCLGAGLPLAKALEASAGRNQALRTEVQFALARCETGLSLSEALQPAARRFPSFFLPLLRAGEETGRLVEALRLIHEHCERMKPTRRVVRNTWLYPLICILAGWVARLGIFVYFGRLDLAGAFLRDVVLNAMVIVLIGWALLQWKPVRGWIDQALLELPLVGKTERSLGIALFLATFRLVYEAGGLPVTTMLDLALGTVRNTALRRDLARARPVLEENGSFEEAFAQPAWLSDLTRNTIATGALSGQLGTSLAQVVRVETSELEFRLELFNRIFQRLVAFGVALSIVGSIMLCLAH